MAIDAANDQTGAFVFRSVDGSGDVNWQNNQLRWDYGTDGVDDNALVDIQVFAIEMVYVPTEAFRLGTGRNVLTSVSNEVGEFYTPGSTFTRLPYLVTSEAAITVANSNGNLYYDNTEPNAGDQLGPIPAAFPKGFAAFYCMKYEVSQDQWIGFFNSLTQTQKGNLDITGPDGKNSDNVTSRNAVAWTGGNATTTLPNIPLNFVRNNFTLAYLDWAGLRPQTELEFEKAGRGPLEAVADEFAWGTSNIHATVYTLVNQDTPQEAISNPGSGTGNAGYNGSFAGGPLRCGIFAASALLNNREETGGSYYGIMELSGNVYERLITVGNPQGRAFSGNHGDGELLNSGFHNVAGWPAADAGLGFRGGSVPNGAAFLRLSDRNDAANTFSGTNSRIGFRGVRTAE